MPLNKKVLAEFFGTFWLVFAGCGCALLSAAFPGMGVGFLGVALAFGLSVLTMAYAVGHISGGHFNPAVSIGLAVGGRFPGRELPAYIIAQVAGAMIASSLLYLIATGKPDFDLGNFAANGYGAHSPGGYSLLAGAILEFILAFMFLMVIQGATDERAPEGFAPLAIGLTLALAVMVGLPVTNASINPARSTGPALFAGWDAIRQLWLFWVAPIAGAICAGLVYPALSVRRAVGPIPATRLAA